LLALVAQQITMAGIHLLTVRALLKVVVVLAALLAAQLLVTVVVLVVIPVLVVKHRALVLEAIQGRALTV
jgi:hypothetical protein